MDIGTFFVQRVIIHQIPKARKAEKAKYQIGYSFAPSPLDDSKRRYFRRRITSSLQKAFDVVRDPDQPSTVPDLMLGFYEGTTEDDEFVSMSQGIAEHLYVEQGGISSAGLVAVVEGTIGTGKKTGKCLAVLKLEMEPGIHLEQIEVDGKKTFEVTVEDVTLTEGTRVFKASLFPRFSQIESLSGLVSDDQLESTTIGRDIAEFFLRRFLGCKMAPTPGESTKQFLTKAIEYFNTLPDDEAKIRYELLLRAEFERQTPTIDPTEFARKNLATKDRDPFLESLRQEDGRVAVIEKNTSRIANFLKESWVFLDNGVRIVGPPEEVRRAVTAIRTATDDKGELIVKARIKDSR
jgi:37-kD nucleoid-associated bacterial protein